MSSTTYRNREFVTTTADPVLTLRVWPSAVGYIVRCQHKMHAMGEPSLSLPDFIRNEVVRYFGAAGVKSAAGRRTAPNKLWAVQPSGYYQLPVRLPIEVLGLLKRMAEAKHCSVTEIIYKVVVARSKVNGYGEKLELADFKKPPEERMAPGRRAVAICCPNCGSKLDRKGNVISTF